LDGKYALLRELGAGGTGTVYEAENLLVGKRVAIKVLHRELARDQSLCTRFVAEARAAARIAHANVVDIHDLGITREGLSYMVMELLSGETLSDIIGARGALAADYACELMLQVLAGLAAAHAEGIVHRDLKPSNVIVTHPRPHRPLVKVLDFGIAKGMGTHQREDLVLGTPMYMAPEQALGREVDARADVYAAGAILYELLAGRPLFQGTVAEVMTRVIAGEFRPLRELNPNLPADLVATVDAALTRDPRQRLQSAEEFAERLMRFVSLDGARSLIPTSTESGSPIPLVATDAKYPATVVEPVVRELTRTGTFPPAELVRIDRWSGDRFMTHSLLEQPRIPRAPSPPRLNGRGQALFAAPRAVSPSERAARRATTEHLAIPMQKSRLHGALIATLFGFLIGLVVALLLGLI
jgi:serine/threonine-protein kinase